MIVINDIKEKPADLYCPAGELIGTVSTDLQMNDVCLQIKRLIYCLMVDSPAMRQ